MIKMNKHSCKTIFLFILVLVLFSSFALAQSPEDDYFSDNPLYKGDIYFSLDKTVYSAGENLSTDFVVSNLEDFPIAGAYLVVEVGKGGEPGSDSENIFYETVLRDIDLPPLGSATVPFNYALPSDLSSGDYSLEVYLKTDRTNIVGLPHIFMSPVSHGFSVAGTGGFPYAAIFRPGSLFVNESGQVGPGVDAGSVVVGAVSVVRESGGYSLDGLVLSVYVCDWDDTACVVSDDLYWSGDYPVTPSQGNDAEASVGVGFVAPSKPSAYAIRLELKDSFGRIVSLYRSRIVVKGETARIRKMAVDKSYYGAGDAGRIMVLVGPSPDSYTNPLTANATVSVFINSGGETLFTASSVVPELSDLSYPDFVFESFNFTSPRELRVFEVCSQVVSSSGLLFDRYCYPVDSSKFAVPQVCGDGMCGVGEDSMNCCVDCGCAQGKDCVSNVCRAAESGDTQKGVDYLPYILVVLAAVIIILVVSKKRRKKK
jgi:hypothetical protein